MNPYDPPTSSLETRIPTKTVRARRGPALYLLFGGSLGGVVAFPLLAVQSPLAFVAILMGSVSGGLLYRWVSSDWPHDESVRRQQLIYSVFAALFPTIALAIHGDNNSQVLEYALIGAAIGGSAACGIFVSGTKRLNIPSGG